MEALDKLVNIFLYFLHALRNVCNLLSNLSPVAFSLLPLFFQICVFQNVIYLPFPEPALLQYLLLEMAGFALHLLKNRLAMYILSQALMSWRCPVTWCKVRFP